MDRARSASLSDNGAMHSRSSGNGLGRAGGHADQQEDLDMWQHNGQPREHACFLPDYSAHSNFDPITPSFLVDLHGHPQQPSSQQQSQQHSSVIPPAAAAASGAVKNDLAFMQQQQQSQPPVIMHMASSNAALSYPTPLQPPTSLLGVDDHPYGGMQAPLLSSSGSAPLSSVSPALQQYSSVSPHNGLSMSSAMHGDSSFGSASNSALSQSYGVGHIGSLGYGSAQQQQLQQQSQGSFTDSYASVKMENQPFMSQQQLLQQQQQRSFNPHQPQLQMKQASEQPQPMSIEPQPSQQLTHPPQLLSHQRGSDQRSVSSVSSAASGSTPDAHLAALSGASSHSDRSSNHTSPLVSSPQSPANPNSPAPLPTHANSPTPLPSAMAPIVHRNSGVRSVIENTSAASGTTHGLVGTLQSPTDILFSVHLFAGSGKKKSWPSRLISLQSLNNPSVSFAQLLFHAANISSFLSVSVDGKEIPDATAAGVTVCQTAPVKARLEQVAQAAAAQGLSTTHARTGSATSHLRPTATDDREHSLSSSSRQSHGSSQPTHYSSALDLPALEIIYHFADNIKSCTRLGCLNLLVIKSNRRACNICQSQGAEIPASLLRRLIIHPHHSPSQYAYLDQILEEYEYWKFDSLDDHSIANATGGSNGSAALAVGSSSANNGAGFPFAKQAGYYIAFVDAGTARHVQRDFNHKIGGSSGLHGADAASSTMVEVDRNFTYAIKMKSHFWMLEVRARASDGSPATGTVGKNGKDSKAKSKFYKKVGKPNQSRGANSTSAAAAALMHQQQQQQQQGFLVPFGAGGQSVHSTPNVSSRRFDHGDDSGNGNGVGNAQNVLHINHININMPQLNLPKLMSPSQQGSQQGGAARTGGATIEIIDEPTSNSVHVSDTSFRLMKNQPVNALLSVHDNGSASGNSSSAAAAAASSGSGTATEPVDSKPLVGVPTPVVLVYRDMDAYQRDVSSGGGGGFNGGSGGFGGSSGSGGNDNSDYNSGGGGNGGSLSGHKRSRFNGPSSGGNNGGGTGSHPMNTANALNLSMIGGNLQMGAALGLNPASMAGVAAAVNQFQFAQVAQAQQLQQQLFQQVARDYGRFQAPWVYSDMSAAAVAEREAAGIQPPANGGTQGDIELMPVVRRGRRRRNGPRVNADGSTFEEQGDDEKDDGGSNLNDNDDDEEEEIPSDSQQQSGSEGSDEASASNAAAPRHKHEAAVGDDGDSALNEEESQELIGELSQSQSQRQSLGEGGQRHKPSPLAPPSGRAADRHGQQSWPGVSPASNVGVKKRNNNAAAGVDRDSSIAQMLLVEELDGRVHKGMKPAIKSLQPQEEPSNLPYKAFQGMGPWAGFWRSFHFWRQSFYGTLLSLLLGLLALIILSKNVHRESEDEVGKSMQLIFYSTDLPKPIRYQDPQQVGGSKRVLSHQEQGFYVDHDSYEQQESVLDAYDSPDLHGALQEVQRAARLSKAAAAATSGNGTDTSDPVTLSRRLAASLQLFASMRESSVIYNTWASSAPVAVANMLNPPPGAPAVVNFDVLSNNCKEGVRIARAIGDYILSRNGLLAAFSSLAAPAMFPPVTTSSQLCSVLSGEVGSIFLYELVCAQWLVGNSVSIPLGSTGLSCSSDKATWNTQWNADRCVEVMESVHTVNMTNAFFIPYNTSASTGSSPTVYAAAGPTTAVTPTTLSPGSSVPITVAPAPNAAQLAALNSLPHLGALSFYAQAANLRSLCTNFNVILGLISQLAGGSTTSNSGSTTGATTTLSDYSAAALNYTTAGGYKASGTMMGFVAIGGFGLLMIIQLALFLVLILARSCCGKVKAGVQGMAEVAMPGQPMPKQQKQPTRSGARA